MTRADAGAPLRVGLVIPSLAGGGAEFVALQWASYLAREGHRPTVITTHDPGGSLDGVEVVDLAAPTFRHGPRACAVTSRVATTTCCSA